VTHSSGTMPCRFSTSRVCARQIESLRNRVEIHPVEMEDGRHALWSRLRSGERKGLEKNAGLRLSVTLVDNDYPPTRMNWAQIGRVLG
jgi:hypothetical protein